MEFRVAVDRMENNAVAVLEAEGLPGTLEWPTALLPPGTGDGDILVFRIEPDPEAGERQRRRIKRVQSELAGDMPPQDR